MFVNEYANVVMYVMSPIEELIGGVNIGLE
jgi:hypothetical protein